MARPLAALARPGAGAVRPRRKRQDASRPCLRGARAGGASSTPAELAAERVPALLGDAQAAILDDAERVLEGPGRGAAPSLQPARRARRPSPAGCRASRRRAGPSRSPICARASLAAPAVAVARARRRAARRRADQALRRPAIDRGRGGDRPISCSSIERSFAAARGAVAALDRAALAAHRRVTVPLARRVLESGPESGQLT